MTAASLTFTRWHRMAMAAAMVIAALSVGAAATAIARPSRKTPFSSSITWSVSHELVINKGELPQEAHESCRTDLGGIYNINTDKCYLPDQTTADPGGQPTAPPPGATGDPPPIEHAGGDAVATARSRPIGK